MRRWQRDLAVHYLKRTSVFQKPRVTAVRASAVTKAYDTGMNQMNSRAALMPTYTDFDARRFEGVDSAPLRRK